MKTLSIFALISIVSLSLISCAATYEAPTLQPQDFTRSINGSQATIFSATKKALIFDGYQIATSDQEAGVISTDKKLLKLTEQDCDCGTTMGLPYIKDNRTSTHVTIGLVITDNQITIKPTIEGDYLKGHTSQSIEMVCISTGRIEQALFDKITANVK